MSNDSFWYTPCHLAGPPSTLIRLSPDTVTTSSTGAGSGSPSQSNFEHYVSQFLQKRLGSDTHPSDQYTIPPYFPFPFDIDHDSAAEMVEPCFGPTEHKSHEASMPPVLSVIQSGTDYTEDFDTIEDIGSNEAVMTDPRPTWLSFRRHPGASQSSSVSSVLSLENLDVPLDSPPVVTPNLEEPEDSHRDYTNHSQVYSPYAPMPLPPIFSFEPQSRMWDITIDGTPSSHPPFWPAHDDKCVPIDPALPSQPPGSEPAPAIDAGNGFARGRTTSECVWPPFSAEYQVPEGRKRCPKTVDISTDIPLSVAERQANEFRATGPNVLLTLSFLMTFMGQRTEQSPWQCYIRGCHKTLNRKSHMVDHIRMHLNERVYACHTCPRTFLRKADCKRHALAHDPHKAFRCNSCLKSFGRKDLLTRHNRSCKPNNEWIPLDLDEQDSMRKGISRTSTLDTKSAQGDGSFITPNMLLSPPEGLKNGSKRSLGTHGENKENISPFLLPSGPMFNNPSAGSMHGTDPDGRRKKARTRI